MGAAAGRARRLVIAATETSLISALESPLAPVWVWAAFGEVPTTMVGGTVVPGAVVGHVVAESHPVSAHRDTSCGDIARRESL
jgi:hypothetical protein